MFRVRDKQHHRGPWHYMNLPFKPDGPSDKDSPNSANLREQRGKDFLLLGPRGTSTLANGGVLRLTEKEFAARNLCPSTSKSMGVQRVLFYFSGNL